MTQIIIDKSLPDRIWPGDGAALLLSGYARGRSRLRAIELQGNSSIAVDTIIEPAYAHVDECCASEVPASCLQSGFTTLVRLPADIAPGAYRLRLIGRFADGQQQPVPVDELHIESRPPQERAKARFRQGDAGRRTFICMAAWEPDEQRLRRQIESIKAQTLTSWHCIINDDASSDEAFARYAQVIGKDTRFSVYRNTHNLGFYGNFEVALSRVPDDADFVALADQDDYWYPDKLATCLDAFANDEQLVYSDMQVVDEDGAMISPSYWSGRRNNYRDAHVLFIANTVTGAASVFRAGLLREILPFPEPVGQVFHDHWIACVARCRGSIGYIDRPLYDYYQYGSSVIGHCDFERRTLLQRVTDALVHLPQLLLPRQLKAWLQRKRNAALNVFHLEYLRLYLFAETLRLRLPDMPSDASRWLGMFSAGWGAIFRLLHAHLLIMLRGDTTNDAELRLAGGLLAHKLDRLYVRLLARRIIDKHCQET
jgi:glycosyltransferase involved in cell wall biosynthesis